ncbi:MAG: hypothetical protein ACP5JG_09755 [Anaerolineae bacterium]
MSALSFYHKVIMALEQIEARYMIVGAFAGLAFGVTRATFDVDILVDLREDDFEALAARFPPPRYYADPEMMRNSTRMGIMFNLIDVDAGVKADLVPLTREPDYRTAFSRRIRRTFQDETGRTFTAWYAQPTDIIIGKLMAWNEGRSAKHPADIYAMLIFAISDLSDVGLDIQAITVAATRLGPDVVELWRSLRERAEEDVRRQNG